MSTLNPSSSVFRPQVIMILDDFIASVLLQMNDYYIKGGKAFNYYYPQEQIPTVDVDLVATNSLCTIVFQALHSLIGKKIQIETYEPFIVQACSEENMIYQDKDASKQVRSFYIQGIPVMDVIITDTIPQDHVEVGTNGLHYLAKPLFKQDLYETLEDREKKVVKPTKKSQKRVKRKEKLRKTQARVSIAKKYGGKKRMKRT